VDGAVSKLSRLESATEARVSSLEKHGLEDSLCESLVAIETRKQERQKQARLALLEHLLEGQPPITDEERAAVQDDGGNSSLNERRPRGGIGGDQGYTPVGACEATGARGRPLP
jgi:hypothetical protein